jgi:hypothetical protein
MDIPEPLNVISHSLSLVYIKWMQHWVFLDYSRQQQFSTVRFCDLVVKIQLEV